MTSGLVDSGECHHFRLVCWPTVVIHLCEACYTTAFDVAWSLNSAIRALTRGTTTELAHDSAKIYPSLLGFEGSLGTVGLITPYYFSPCSRMPMVRMNGLGNLLDNNRKVAITQPGAGCVEACGADGPAATK